MGIKTLKTTQVIKVCPNQEKHTEDLLNSLKANPNAAFLSPALSSRNHVFCGKCGAKLIDETINHEHTVCEKCGEEIHSTDFYCPNCGDRLR